MSQQDELVEALNAETNKIIVSGKSLKLKASEKAVEELYNTGLVGKLLADKSINKNAVKAIILKAWRTSRGLQIVDLRENIFLFKFACEGDKRRIVELGPWNIEGFPLILKQWNQNMVVEDLDFSSLPIWIQIHNLPIEYMSKENAVEIGSLVGEVVDVDFTGDGEVCMCKFLRVKVEVKVDDPLRSGFYLDRSPHPDLWIQFKYERVAEFCYKCGRLGHLKARYLKVSHIDAQIPSKEPYGFGHWMKAESSGRKTSRWVEFMAEESSAKQQNSKKRVEEEHVEYAQSEAGNEERQVEGSRSSLTNFERLADHVTSNQPCSGNCLQLSPLNKPENHPSYKNQNPLTESLVTTTPNTLTPMETELTDVINSSASGQNQSHMSAQDTQCIESQQPQNLKPDVASNNPSPQYQLNQPSGPI